MKDILPTLQQWTKEGKRFALARVVRTWGSAPRRPGAWMGISSDGKIVGSVSGGCVEGAVREDAMAILEGARPRLLEFGIDNESAWNVGLSCGGQLSVAVQPFPFNIGRELLEAIDSGRPVVWTSELSVEAERDTLTDSPNPTSATLEVREEAGNITIVQHIPKPATILIIGGADIAVHLVQMADRVGFETIIVDPRAVFTTADRFPVMPTHLHTAWPQEILPDLPLEANTFAVLLTHDPKIDDPAIDLILASNIKYVGALGGRKTQQKRRERLIANGYSDKDLDRIRGPVGLDIGAASPAEIAVSILAEIIQVRNSKQ